MAAGLIVPITGPYTATFNAFTMGTMSDDGYELSVNFKGQEINASDAFGMTLVEGIWRGQDWRCRIRGLEWDKRGLLFLLQSFGGGESGTALSPTLANIGERWTKFAYTLLLSAVLGSPPTKPQTLTATNAALAPNSTTAFNLTSKMREMPIEMVLLPYASTVSAATTNIPFSTT